LWHRIGPGHHDDLDRLVDVLRAELVPVGGGHAHGREHHEIYLSGVRRTPARGLRAVLRQPVEHAGASGTT
jgi:hypothetical protein